MRIVLDAFGSDNAPLPEIIGAVLAVRENYCDKVILVGDEDIIKRELSKHKYPKNKIEVVHSKDVISMEDDPTTAARTKHDSSMVKALTLYKEGKADAFLSAGNTGAIMAASLFTIGRIKNVLRPAIAITFPTVISTEIILDVGANVDCEPEYLEQFGIIGSLYAKFTYNNPNPRVALLNIGEESKKGNELTKKAYKLLSENSAINFIGNIEGKDVLKGTTEVIICDGFVGNIMLKSVEGAFFAIFGMLKEQIKKDWVAKIGAMLAFPAFKYIKNKMDASETGGALLVGLNGISVVAHGSSNATAIKNAIKFTSRIAESDFITQVKDYFEGKK
jgi:glycerol-3-phosphate acyltransferase PlsX